MIHTAKFHDKYMNIAASIAKENDSCYSRKLGCIIVDKDHKVRGIGYNGPPRGTPHTDSEEYLRDYFWPQLTKDDLASLGYMYDTGDLRIIQSAFLEEFKDKKICPRKVMGCESGQRPLLCSCVHAEANAIANSENVVDCAMYCVTPIPCLPCAGLIINAGIKEVFCKNDTYHAQSKWLFEQAGVKLVTYT
jgi:deoxycytidylate deaminase